MKDNEFNYVTLPSGLAASIDWLDEWWERKYGFWLLHQCAGEWVNDAPAF